MKANLPKLTSQDIRQTFYRAWRKHFALEMLYGSRDIAAVLTGTGIKEK